jgi:hypothetical protein
MLKKLIGGVVILAAVAFGGYVGYCMVFKGETFFQAMGSAQKKVEAEVGARLTPLRRADLEYGRNNRKEALEHYQEALRRTDLPTAPAQEKLTDQQRQHVVRRIAELTPGPP